MKCGDAMYIGDGRVLWFPDHPPLLGKQFYLNARDLRTPNILREQYERSWSPLFVGLL